MKPNQDFLNKPLEFWGYVRLISEKMGYSVRNKNLLKKPTAAEVILKLNDLNINIDNHTLDEVLEYIHYRADILNNEVQYYFMNLDEAQTLFNQLHKIYKQNNFTSKLPMIKQSGEKRIYALLTCIVNILTEAHLRSYAHKNGLIYGFDVKFDDDPSALTYVTDNNNYVQGTLSRRYDGAIPSINNPVCIWEIKEYYNTTSFGSRVAGGVYETQLDGFEINELSNILHRDIKHFYIIDAFYTWWVKGRSYLCRIIDSLHMGLVDEVIFGKEIFNRWTDTLDEILEIEEHLVK